MSRSYAAALCALLGAAGVFAGPASVAPWDGPVAPDYIFFAERLHSEAQLRCGGCHEDRETAGRFLLAGRNLPDAALRDFRTALLFLDDAAPERSPLLVKALGGAQHGGGAVYASASRVEFEPWLDFALGSTLGNRPPDAILPKRMEGGAGGGAELDGTLSGDRDGDRISYRWALLSGPEGSVARIEPPDGPTARLLADRPGEYRVSLRVFDGRLWSAAAVSACLLAVPAAAPRDEGAMPVAAPPGSPGPSAPPSLDGRLDPDRLKMVRRLYMDLLWRSPTLEELARHHARSQEQTVDELLRSEECWSAWYESQLYYFLLLDQFRPKEGPIPQIPARIAKGELTVPRALEEVVRSQYFGARNPGNDTFCTVVLEQLLGMTVQEPRNRPILEAGKRMYDGYKSRLFREDGDSQADFVRIVFRQPAFCEHLLGRTYESLCARPLDRKRREGYRARLAADPKAFPAILAEWLTGPDYAEAAKEPRTKPEVPYVRALFLDTLGRLPTYDELRNVRNAFLSMADPTPVRLVMGRVLLESSTAAPAGATLDARRFVREQFLRLLARPPTAAEEETFSNALRNDPGTTPRIVLYTLLSSAEYQIY